MQHFHFIDHVVPSKALWKTQGLPGGNQSINSILYLPLCNWLYTLSIFEFRCDVIVYLRQVTIKCACIMESLQITRLRLLAVCDITIGQECTSYEALLMLLFKPSKSHWKRLPFVKNHLKLSISEIFIIWEIQPQHQLAMCYSNLQSWSLKYY